VSDLTGQKSIDIIERTLNHEVPPRTPVMPVVGLASTRHSGVSIKEVLHDGRKQADSQLHALRHFGYDGVFTVMDLTLEAEALGATVEFKDDAPPYVRKHAVNTPEQLLELKPISTDTKRVAAFVDAARFLAKEVGRSHLVTSYIPGPFTLCGQVLGLERLLDLCIEGDERAVRLVGHCRSLVSPLIEKYAAAGVHNIAILEPSASGSIVSPDYFKRYSLPYLKELVSEIHRSGTKATLHICGKAKPLVEMMASVRADVLSLDSAVDLREAKMLVGRRAALMGNVHTTLMLSGTTQQVSAAARDCLDKASSGGGFILSTGCDTPIETPEANLTALVRAALV